MSHSSIFNFESFEGFKPRVPLTVLGVAGVLLVLEIGVRLIPEESLIPAKSRQGEIIFLERELLPRVEKPRVLVLGSSRIRRAVVPKLLDEKAGLPANSTLNCGLASGRVYEAKHLYDRNVGKLGKADLVILNIDEWHLSQGWRLGSLYELHAPWSERVAFAEPLRSRMILDGIFSMRLKLPLIPSLLKRKKDTGPNLKLDENNQVLPPARKNKKESSDAAQYATEMETFYNRFRISAVLEGHIEALAKEVKARGGKFVLLQLPNRAAYQAEVIAKHGQEYQNHVAALKALATRLDAPLFIYDDPKQCGLNDESFEDYGHMTPEGGRAFTAFLAELIQREKWLK